MATFKISKPVSAAPARAFEVFADIRNAANHVTGIKRLEVLGDGPIGKGTRFRETRVMFKKDHTEELEITDFQPGSSYTVGCISCGAAFSSTYRFSPDGGGTRVDLEMRTTPITFMAKLMSPLSGLFAGGMFKMIDRDLEDLKAVVESNGAPRRAS